jgi:hypothetical protein
VRAGTLAGEVMSHTHKEIQRTDRFEHDDANVGAARVGSPENKTNDESNSDDESNPHDEFHQDDTNKAEKPGNVDQSKPLPRYERREG